MIPLFDTGDAFADDFRMGYDSHTAELKIECVRRYFSEPRISMRTLAKEKGVSFSTLSSWVQKARKAGMLNPGEGIPAMVEVRPALPSSACGASAAAPSAEAVTISIGRATVTVPPSLLPQALEALPRQ